MTTTDKALSSLTAHSNLVILCHEYQVNKEQIKSCIKNEEIKIIDQKVPINGTDSNDKWSDAWNSVVELLNININKNADVLNLLAVIKNRSKFVGAIADEIIRQLKRKYDNQGALSWLTQGIIIILTFLIIIFNFNNLQSLCTKCNRSI